MRFCQFYGNIFQIKFEACGEGGIIQGPLKNGLVLPISFGCNSIRRFKKFRIIFQCIADLIESPNIEPAFFAFRIRIK